MAEEKTEEPTPKKLREARKRGEVAKSREVASAALVLAVAGVLYANGEAMLATFEGSFALSIAAIRGEVALGLTDVLGVSAEMALSSLAPLLGAAVIVAALASFLQVGPLLTTEPLAPKLERIDPIRGTKNLFSQKNLVELLKALLKLGIIGYVAWITLEDGVRGLSGLAARDARAALSGTSSMVALLLFRVGGAMAAIAVLDVLYQRWRFRQDQKMTKQEVEREYKESEGDPHQQRERERVHREILAHDTVMAVQSADVLVVNPTHLAVALRYDQDEEVGEAPEVVAKGQEELAQRMIRAAEAAGVPVMRDVPLARALFELEVGEEIPEAFYEAVAVILKAAWAERDEEAPR